MTKRIVRGRQAESPWTRRVCEQMQQAGAVVLSLVGSRMQQPGWPDRYVAWSYYNIMQGCFCTAQAWLEFKATDGVLSDIQRVRIAELRKRGVLAVVVRFPNIIENELGTKLSKFDSTGSGLLQSLEELLGETYDS